MPCLLLSLMALLPGIPPQPATPANCWLRDLASPDGNSVFLLCEQGGLFRSRDLRRWEAIRIPARERVRALHFLDESHGVVVGDSGLVMVTTDGGMTWRAQHSGTRENLTSVYGIGTKIWAGGFGGVILHSPDGGLNWRTQPTFASTPIESVYFLDGNRGWAAGWAGLLLRTTDGGESWQHVSPPGVGETLNCVRFRDPRNGWAVGMFGAILRTRDGGATWQEQPAVPNRWLTSIAFGRDGAVWIAAEYSLLRSDDGGETWREVTVEMPASITHVLATPDSVVAAGPGFVLTRSGNESAWLRLDIDEIARRAGSLAQQPATVNSLGGRS